MSFFARRSQVFLLVCAAFLLVACNSRSVTPEPTPTKTRQPTLTPLPPSPTPEPIGPPTTSAATAAVPSTPMRSTRAQVPKAAAADPLLPVFGPFPPKPVPARPSNLNPLTGLAADPAALQRRPLLVRIGNDQKVRTDKWQAGLTSADLVFEELIDILGSSYANTRYTAVFLSQNPPLIGPVRSGRIINFQLVPMLDGALSHAGASNGTRWLFSKSPMINLDEYFNQPAYCYEKSHGYQGRLYTTGPRLREWLTKKGWEKPVPLYGFDFADAPPAGQAATSIALTKSPWPRWDQVEWRYDASKSVYMRYVTGQQLVDKSYPVTAKWGYGADCQVEGSATETPVSAANVVVLFAEHEKTNIVEDSNNSVSVHIVLTGQGDAQFARDGIIVKGKWQRQFEQEFLTFTDAAGKPITLKPGNTWFEIVPLGYTLDVK